MHLKAYGFIKVFTIASDDGDIEYWATNSLKMKETKRKVISRHSWKIEEYPREHIYYSL